MSILMKWDPDGHLYRQLHLGKHRTRQLELVVTKIQAKIETTDAVEVDEYLRVKVEQKEMGV